MYKRRRSAHAGQPCDSSCYTDQRVEVGMGAQGNAPMCRGLGCVPGRMSRRRAQLASYPGIARGVPVDPPPPPTPPKPPAPVPDGDDWIDDFNARFFCHKYPQSPLCKGRDSDSPGESYASQASRMQRRRAEVIGHYRSVPNSEHGKVWSRGNNPGESYIVTDGEDADIWIGEHRRG